MTETMPMCDRCLESACTCGEWLKNAPNKKALPSFQIKAIVRNGVTQDLDEPVTVIVDRDTLVLT